MPWPIIVQGRHDGERNTPTLATTDAEVMAPESHERDVEPMSVLVTAGVDVDAQRRDAEPEHRDPWEVMPRFATESGDAAELVESPGWRSRTPR